MARHHLGADLVTVPGLAARAGRCGSRPVTRWPSADPARRRLPDAAGPRSQWCPTTGSGHPRAARSAGARGAHRRWQGPEVHGRLRPRAAGLVGKLAPLGVFQFTKSPSDGGSARRTRSPAPPGQVHAATGRGAASPPGTGWARAGPGCAPPLEDHARAAREGWEQVEERDLAAQTYRLIILDEFTYPLSPTALSTPARCRLAILAARPGVQHVSDHPAAGSQSAP